jgi:hypothetical protein
MSEDAENFLEHFGVKGMKWGVRQNRSSASPSTNAKTKPLSRRQKKEAYEEAVRFATKYAKENPNGLVLVKQLNNTTIVSGKVFFDYQMNTPKGIWYRPKFQELAVLDESNKTRSKS